MSTITLHYSSGHVARDHVSHIWLACGCVYNCCVSVAQTWADLINVSLQSISNSFQSLLNKTCNWQLSKRFAWCLDNCTYKFHAIPFHEIIQRPQARIFIHHKTNVHRYFGGSLHYTLNMYCTVNIPYNNSLFRSVSMGRGPDGEPAQDSAHLRASHIH